MKEKSTKNFSGVDLRAYCFRYSNMVGRNFRGADLRECTFAHANLVDADFRGADLRKTDIHKAHVAGAKFDRETKLPFACQTALELGMVATSS